MTVPAVEQRLDAEAVPKQMQLPRRPVPQGNRKHPDEAGDSVGPPLRERRKNHLGISRSRKAMSERLQLSADLLEVVDFAVEDHHPGLATRHHGLMPQRTEIKNRQSPMPETGPVVGVEPEPLVVGPAMMERLHGPRQPCDPRLHIRADNAVSRNPTHAAPSPMPNQLAPQVWVNIRSVRPSWRRETRQRGDIE